MCSRNLRRGEREQATRRGGPQDFHIDVQRNDHGVDSVSCLVI